VAYDLGESRCRLQETERAAPRDGRGSPRWRRSPETVRRSRAPAGGVVHRRRRAVAGRARRGPPV